MNCDRNVKVINNNTTPYSAYCKQSHQKHWLKSTEPKTELSQTVR